MYPATNSIPPTSSTSRPRALLRRAVLAVAVAGVVGFTALSSAGAKPTDAATPMLTARTVKFFADGVVENETGALLEPYCSALHKHGLSVWGAEDLAEAVRAVDAAGFQVHIHAIGDAAVRQALDAIEHAVEANGQRDRRPVIAHAQLVDDADLDRFARLGASDDDTSPVEERPVEGVQRLAPFEHDIIGDIDDVVDRTHTGRLQSLLYPGG